MNYRFHSNNDGTIDAYDDPVETISFGQVVGAGAAFSVHVEPKSNFTMDSSRYGARIMSSNQAVVATAAGGRQLTLGAGNVEFQSGTAPGTTTLTYEIYEKSTGTVLATDSVLVTIGNWAGVDCAETKINENSLEGNLSNVVVSLTSAPAESVTVTYVVGGAAKYGVDYTLTLPSNVTFVQSGTGGSGTITFDASGDLSKTFLVTASQDRLVEKLLENITFTIFLPDNPSGIYAIAQDRESVEVEIEDMDTLKVDYVGFVNDLYGINMVSDPQSGNWNMALNWICDKQLSNQSSDGYVPKLYASTDKVAVECAGWEGNISPELVNLLYVQFDVIINGKTYTSNKQQLSKRNYNIGDIYPSASNCDLRNDIQKWGVEFENISLEKTFQEIFGRPQAMYEPNFELSWKLYIEDPEKNDRNHDEIIDKRDAGTSTSCMYVTYKAPVSGMPLYHSVVHLGCVAAASVTTGREQDVFDAIWAKFQSLEMHQVDIKNGKVVENHIPMSYYGKSSTAQNTDAVKAGLCLVSGEEELSQLPSLARETDIKESGLGRRLEGLLQKNDGTCGAWQELLYCILTSQGLTNVETCGILTTSNSTFFKVKRIDGQGNIQPKESIWRDHGVVVYNGNVYDPSYGVTYGSKNTAIASFIMNSLESVGTTTVLNSLDPDTGYGRLYSPINDTIDAGLFMWD